MLKKITLFMFVFIACLQTVVAQTPTATPEKRYGPQMTVKDVVDGEAQLKRNPKDADTRKSLIDYYESKKDTESQKSLRQHRKLLVQHSPEGFYGGSLGYWSSEEDKANPEFIEIKNEWLKQVAANKDNAEIRNNAVRFLAALEPEAAEKLLREGQAIEPDNEEYSGRLIDLLESNVERLNAAYDAQEKAITLAAIDKETKKLMTEIEHRLSLFKTEGYLKESGERLEMLVKAAKVALELNDVPKAKTYAETILADFITYEPEEDDNEAIFHANMLLARVAVREKNLALAKEKLFKSLVFPKIGEYKISEQEFDVLAEMLSAGEKAAVIEYAKRAQKLSDETIAKVYRLWERKLSRNLSPLVKDGEYY